jgi:hypothetical protein
MTVPKRSATDCTFHAIPADMGQGRLLILTLGFAGLTICAAIVMFLS